MKRRILTCVIICFLSVISFSASATHGIHQKSVMRNNVHIKKFCSSYIASLLLSGGVGATTGWLTRYFEDRIIGYVKRDFKVEALPIILGLRLLGWALESEIRNDIIAGLQGDLDAYQIEYKKNLMFKSACIVSWLAYFQL